MRTLADGAREILNELSGRSGLRSIEPNMMGEAHSASNVYDYLCRWHRVPDERREELIARGYREIEKARARCDSPIEKLIVPWLVFQDYGATPSRLHEPATVVPDLPKITEILPGCVLIAPQLELGFARLDFAVMANTMSGRALVAVECDGQEFHDARADKIRDFWVLEAGITTVRLTGSEIHNSPRDAARKVAHALLELGK